MCLCCKLISTFQHSHKLMQPQTRTRRTRMHACSYYTLSFWLRYYTIIYAFSLRMASITPWLKMLPPLLSMRRFGIWGGFRSSMYQLIQYLLLFHNNQFDFFLFFHHIINFSCVLWSWLLFIFLISIFYEPFHTTYSSFDFFLKNF